MLKLIASDMDGTLLNEKITISDANVQAIREAQQQGIKFLVATGRGFEQAAPLLEEAEISCPIIALNGAQLFDENGKLVYNRGIEKDQVREVLNIIEENGAHGEIMTTDGTYSDDRERRLESFAHMEMEVNPNLTLEEARQHSRKRLEVLQVSFVEDYETILQQDSIAVLKVSAFHEDGPSALEPLTDKILAKVSDLAITSSNISNIEINHTAAQKGIALKEYAEKLGIKAEEVMSIGDNINDVSMLEWAGLSFAMDNARDEAKQAAKYHSSSNVENGVAEAITRLLQRQEQLSASGKLVDK